MIPSPRLKLWDHPRVGGEKVAVCFTQNRVKGSPPRGRGKVSTCCCASIGGRITPAWAGKSSALAFSSSASRDHPRVGGEKKDSFTFVFAHEGSPPRGRGKDLRETIQMIKMGITPAWAGKSLSSIATVRSDRDHPRVGGEKGYGCFALSSCRGSPPRGRGKVSTCCCASIGGRITPAWAGKSRQLIPLRFTYADHPRVGGEKTKSKIEVNALPGSPPRGRGKVPETYRYVAGYGITPAWAGKSCHHCVVFVNVWDHPRVGGEK